MSHLTRFAAVFLPVALSLASAPVRADTLSTFDFVGTCLDCIGSANAELVLNDYTVGAAIDSSNFVSLSYGGTDLLAGFTITSSQDFEIGGSIGEPLPGPENVYLFSDGTDFTSSASGFWCVGGGCVADYGFTHAWSVAGGATDLPEPMTIALLGGGLVGLAAFRRTS